MRTAFKLKILLATALFVAGGVLALGQPAIQPPKREFLNAALRREGNAEHGRMLFQDQERLACSKCHTVDGHGGKAGPDLFAVGDKFGRRELIEAVLNPSASIAVGYNTTTIETKGGDEFSGIIKLASDSMLELIGADAVSVRVATADIAQRRTSEISLMPEGLEAGLSPVEFTDLIEFLVSLKQPASATMLEHGMPTDIATLSSPARLEPFVTENLRFAHPVWFGAAPGMTNTFLVVEHETGQTWCLEKRAEGDLKTLFADFGHYDKGTRGLLGIVFHPRFAENRKYYYAKHVAVDGGFSTLVCERTAAPDGKADSGAASRIILKLDEFTNVHYGGGLQFGPDGLLYVGMGDSGPQEDPEGHSQNPQLWLGKMLRVNVDHSEGERLYRVPADNPFVGRAGFRPEIWAWGFREPWRFSFDPLTGDLWVGDVGQDRYEEVDVVRRGENHGWNVYEGFEPFSNRYRRDGATYVPPVFAYGRKYGVSVTGGYVYRADVGSTFYGVYVFGDYESRRLFGLTQENRILRTVRQIGSSPERIVSFGRDHEGNLYVVGYEGMLYRMDFSGAKFE